MLVLLLLVPFARAGGQEDAILEMMGRRAELFVTAIATGKGAAVRGEMSDVLRMTLNDQAQRQIFGSLQQRLGRLEEIGRATVVESHGEDAKVLTRIALSLEHGMMDAVVVFERRDPMARITQFELEPHSAVSIAVPPAPGAEKEPPLPEYADALLFRSEQVPIEAGSWTGEATLLMPRIAAPERPVPGLVILGAEQGFFARDLAAGAATQGIAAIYIADRDGEAAPLGFGDALMPRLQEMADALTAKPGIDAGNLTFAARGLTASLLAPAVGATKPARFVLFDPWPFPVGEYLGRRVSHESGTESAAAGLMTAPSPEAEAAKRLQLGILGEDEVLHGAPGSRWNELRGLDPAGAMQRIGVPFACFFSQNGDGVEAIAAADQEYWRAGKGPCLVMEGLTPGFAKSDGSPRVDARVVDAVALYIHLGRLPGPPP
ncbi:hypothetical protein HZA57_06635 [Candidatus Poribacteria bacterium]|nr:hypothetical protein [Candidatus Poribacteria bacterium]